MSYQMIVDLELSNIKVHLMMTDIVHLNVGGVQYCVARDTIMKFEHTMLAKLVSEKWNPENNGAAIFIDRNGERFQYILDYYRDGEILLPRTVSIDAIKNDASFFGLPENTSIETSKKVYLQDISPLWRSIEQQKLNFKEAINDFEHVNAVVWALGESLKGFHLSQDFTNNAQKLRPLAKSYIVKGAGNQVVNGLYEFSSRCEDHATYSKQPTQAGEPLLQLVRCTMRIKAEWWFISQFDEEKPRTDKDIDYYRHKSSSEEMREPPCYGWECTSVKTLSIEPSPTLEMVGELDIFSISINMNTYQIEHRNQIALNEKDLLSAIEETMLSLEVDVLSPSSILVTLSNNAIYYSATLTNSGKLNPTWMNFSFLK